MPIEVEVLTDVQRTDSPRRKMNPKFILTWLGVSAFELCLIAVSLVVYLLLLTLRLTTDLLNHCSWWIIYSPLFICDAFWAYFVTIVFIRKFINLRSRRRAAVFGALWSFNQILLIFLFKIFLCLRLEGLKQITHSEILLPLVILSVSLAIRSC